MRVEPFVPPQLWTTPGREALWNAMLSHSGAALPSPRAARRRCSVPTEPPAPQSWAISLLPERAPHLVVVVDSFPFRALFGAELTAERDSDLPPALHAALVEGMVAAVRSVLPAGLIGEVQVLGFGSAGELAGRTEPAGLEWFAVSVAGIAQEPVELRVGCARDALLAALLALEPRARTAWSGLAGRLTATGHFTLGALTLSRAELASSFPERWRSSRQLRRTPQRVRTGAALYRFARTEGGWQCRAREARPAEPHPTSRIGHEHRRQPPAAPHRCRFRSRQRHRADRRDRELATRRGGAAGPAGTDPRAGGDDPHQSASVVGSGDLVTIDERPAVRISRLALGA